MTSEITVTISPPPATKAVEKLMEYEALATDEYDTAELDVDVSSLPEVIPPPPSLAHIYKLCIANFGISGAWALEFAVTTPYFESRLRSGQFLSHMIWIVGPLSGLIVAPIVGAWSDSCTSVHGRRRPFILAGIISTVIGMILFPLAPNIAAFFLKDGSEAHRILAIVIAFIAFCILDLAINTTMWPVRALQADVLHSSQQQRLQSASIVMGSFGDLAANWLVNCFEEPMSHMVTLYFIAMIFYSLTVTSLLLVTTDRQYTPATCATTGTRSKQALTIVSYFRSLPSFMWPIGGTFALGFFSLFCTMPNLSSWLSTVVFQGDPQAADGSAAAIAYERGISTYGQAGYIRAAIQMLYAASCYKLLEWKLLNGGQLLGISFGTFGVLALLLATTSSHLLGRLVVILLGLPMAAHFTLPVGMIVERADESNRGHLLGAMNCFAVIPQLIDTLYTGWVSHSFGEQWVLRLGAIWALLTALSAFMLMTRA